MKRSFLLFVGFLCLQTDVWAHRFGRSHGELCQRVSKIYGGLNNSQLDSAWAKDLPTQKLFEMYNESQGIEIRNAIAERFFSMLEDLAVQMKSKVPSEVEVEDLFVAGLDGLFQSIRDFEPERGVKFETYAAYNVRGRMKDFLREIDWAPRLVRQRETRMKAAKEAFFLSKGRSPDFQELEEALQILAEGEIDKSLDSFVKKTTSKTGVEPTNAVYLA